MGRKQVRLIVVFLWSLWDERSEEAADDGVERKELPAGTLEAIDDVVLTIARCVLPEVT